LSITLATLIIPSVKFSEYENRILTQKPEINIENIWNGQFEKDYESYLNDQFVLRNVWIHFKTTIERLIKRESKDIYFAEDNYFIEQHTDVFTNTTANQNITRLTQFLNQYKYEFAPGHMYVMIIPNAVSILKDKLPPYSSPYDETIYLNKIAQSIPTETWIDTFQTLSSHKNEELYYRTDHHWKTLAAFYVYQQWVKNQGFYIPQKSDYEIKTVTNCFEGTIQSKLGINDVDDTIEIFLSKKNISYTVYKKDSKKIENTVYNFEALNTKDKYAIYFGGNQSLISIQTQLNNRRKILVIKDSYANCFIPFMIDQFQQIDVLDLRYTNQKINELIENGEYTDILILYNASGFAEDTNIEKLNR